MRECGIFLIAIIFMFIVSLGICEEQQVPQESIEQALKQARQVSTELAGKVRGLLLQEIEKGGFGNAVRVCSEVAQDITSRFNEQKGHHTRRVSLRYRSPKNVPDPFEQRKLEEFDRLNRKKKLADEPCCCIKVWLNQLHTTIRRQFPPL